MTDHPTKVNHEPKFRGLWVARSFRVDKCINPRYPRYMKFGKILRQLRLESGMGIKSLAPELRVNYTYLSKLENEAISPSEDLITRVADYFGFDRDALLLSAGKVPEDILTILREHPDDAIAALRKQFGEKDVESEFESGTVPPAN